MALSPSFAGVILAAGASSRMGRDKALLSWQGKTFLLGAIQALRPLTEFVVVVAGENEANLAPIVNAEAAFLVRNPGTVLKLPRMMRNLARATTAIADALEAIAHEGKVPKA